MKLSWHAAHLMFMPRNTCAAFCAACIGGVWLALTTPRQVTPVRKPSGPPCAADRAVPNHRVVRHVFLERGEQPLRDRLALAVIDDALVIAKQIVPEADPVLGVGSPLASSASIARSRCLCFSVERLRSSSGVGGRPVMSSHARRANERRHEFAADLTLFAAKYASDEAIDRVRRRTRRNGRGSGRERRRSCR